MLNLYIITFQRFTLFFTFHKLLNPAMSKLYVLVVFQILQEHGLLQVMEVPPPSTKTLA
jgi:hypothetical protein